MKDFPLFALTDEHNAIRAAVREVVEAKVAPNAAQADATSTFPRASYDALVAADFHASHIPEEFGGVGADALATDPERRRCQRAAVRTMPPTRLSAWAWISLSPGARARPASRLHESRLPPFLSMAARCAAESPKNG